MESWNNNYNWTKQQLENVLVEAKYQNKKIIYLDTEHCDYQNEQDIISWAKELGYSAEVNGDTMIIYLEAKK